MPADAPDAKRPKGPLLPLARPREHHEVVMQRIVDRYRELRDAREAQVLIDQYRKAGGMKKAKHLEEELALARDPSLPRYLLPGRTYSSAEIELLIMERQAIAPPPEDPKPRRKKAEKREP